MKIVRVSAFPIALPVNRGVTEAKYKSKGFRSVSYPVILEIETDEGIVGLGEATVAARWSGETQETAMSVINRVFTPLLLDRDPFNANQLLRDVDASILGFQATKAAVEMALLDIVGKALGVSVYTLLGGPVRSLEIPIRFPIVPTNPTEAAALARDVVSKGCSMIKLKVGHDTVKDDVERVAEVRDAIGSDVRITVDANGGWSVSEAIRACKEFAKYEVLLVEQPVNRWNIDGMAEVRRRVDVPIMADESAFCLRDVLEIIAKKAADVISVYPGKNGGIRNSVHIAEVAQSCGISCAIGSNLEGHIGSCAMGHLAVAVQNVNVNSYNADIIGPLFHTTTVVETPMAGSYDVVHVPDKPGLGVSISEERLLAAQGMEHA